MVRVYRNAGDFTRAERDIARLGIAGTPVADLVRFAADAGVALALVTLCDDDLDIAELPPAPALVVMTAWGLPIERWPQRHPLAMWTMEAVVAEPPISSDRYRHCIRLALEVDRLVLVETSSVISPSISDWAEIFAARSVPFKCFPAVLGSMVEG